MDRIEELCPQLYPMKPRGHRLQSAFITFEGGDGSGKTTQIRRLSAALTARGIPHILTREPGGAPQAEKIRKLLVHGAPEGWDGVSEALLMAAARRDHLRHVIWPALERGDFVLCDRFSGSTFAYQGYGHQLGEAFVNTLDTLTMGDFHPDLTFVFQFPPEKGVARKTDAHTTEDRFERYSPDFHARVAEGYAALLKNHPDRCVPLTADASIETLSARIWEVLVERGFL